MRHLNKKQKKLLEEWHYRNYLEIGYPFSVEKCDAITDLYETLREINDFETINQEIESFIDSLTTSEKNE